MDELYIDDYRVNISRNEIIRQDNVLSLEPKLLKVLLMLAEKPGEIISHQALLQGVWPDVVVEANALQRCIAQLRKAFGDDAKQQRIIATHPRLGYSLVAEVRWQKSGVATRRPLRSYAWLLFCTLPLIVALLTLPLDLFSPKTPKPLSFTHTTPLTTTDAREYRGNFSPDGRYIAFQRDLKGGLSHIWAKDRQSGSEYQLTREPGRYGRPAWSPDGNQLAFPITTRQATGKLAPPCHGLATITLALAKAAPQPPRIAQACGPHALQSVAWLSDKALAYVRRQDDRHEIIRLALADRQLASLYSQPGRYPYNLSYSVKNGQLAWLQADPSDNNELVLLTPGTGDSTQVPLAAPARSTHLIWGGISWHPSGKQLLVADEHSLFTLSLDGEMTEYPVPTYQGIYDPVFHPGGKQVLATLGVVDFDIVEMHWQDKPTPGALSALFRSTLSDSSARYQPGGNSIAFLSERSGSSQLWLNDGEQLRQLSQLPADEVIRSFAWGPRGNLLALEVNNQLRLMDHQGQLEVIDHPFTVLDIFQWVGDSRLLLKVAGKQHPKVVLFDIHNGTTQALYEGAVTWAQQDAQQALYLTNRRGELQRINEQQPQAVNALADTRLNHRFLLEQGQVVYTDGRGGLWQADLKSGEKHRLNSAKERIHYLDDIDLANKRLLYQRFVAARKEIVLFH